MEDGGGSKSLGLREINISVTWPRGYFLNLSTHYGSDLRNYQLCTGGRSLWWLVSSSPESFSSRKGCGVEGAAVYSHDTSHCWRQLFDWSPLRRSSLFSWDRNSLGIDGLCNFLWVKHWILRRKKNFLQCYLLLGVKRGDCKGTIIPTPSHLFFWPS